MATFDYNVWVHTQYTLEDGGYFPTFSPTASTGTVSEPDADTSFESGDMATDSGGFMPGSHGYLGTVEYQGTTFAVFGPPLPLVQDVSYYFFGFSDTPDELNGSSPNPTRASLNTDPFAVCFAAGTLISTPDGERAVETLCIGDLVTTADGDVVPVKWLGLQTLHKVFTPLEKFVPVRVQAGALGQGLPHTDLVLTADHALILDGLAINASALVNGTTIAYVPCDALPEQVTYYHVETEAHEVILANGAPAETYIDYVGRSKFDNHAEYLDLYGEDRTIVEMTLPRVSAARMLPSRIRNRLSPDRVA